MKQRPILITLQTLELTKIKHANYIATLKLNKLQEVLHRKHQNFKNEVCL